MEKAIYCNMDICTGCGACVTACMDENDVDLTAGEVANRRVHKKEHSTVDDFMMRFASVSCMHCDDSPCMVGCPTGAIYRDPNTNAVRVKRDLCIGCHSCALACPFGVPRYDGENKLIKCDLCTDRVNAGMLPACVRVCPIHALEFLSANELSEKKQGQYIGHAIGLD